MKVWPIVLGIVAVVAFLAVSVVALWPVVADAPWENDVSAPIESSTNELRCEGGLALRTEALAGLGQVKVNPLIFSRDADRQPETPASVIEELERRLVQADGEIARYC